MKKILQNIDKLGLSIKKEFSILLVGFLTIILLSALASFLSKNVVFLGIGIGFALVFAFFYLSRYSRKLEIINNQNLEDFSNLFSYFKIYIRNGYSVYSALKEILLFANPSLRVLLDELIKEIDEDKTVQPFVKFAKNFNEIIVEEMMISIYQMIDDGEQSEYLTQFELIFDKFSDLLYQKNLRNKDSRLGTLSCSPLIGSVFLIVVLTIGIITVIGEMINGI